MHLQWLCVRHDGWRLPQSLHGGPKCLPQPPLCTWRADFCLFRAKQCHNDPAMPENAKNAWVPLVTPVATLFRKASVCSHNRPSRGRRGGGLARQAYSTPVLPTAWSMPSQSSRFLRVSSFTGSPQRTHHSAYFGLANVYFSQPSQPSTGPKINR